MLPPLLTRKVGTLYLFCDVWRRRRCSEWVCNVLEVGFRLRFRECPPLTGAPSAFVDKGSIRKRTVLRSLIQSMQQNNVLEVVCDTTSPGCYSHLFLEIPHFTMESVESIRRSLPRDAWVTSINLFGYLYPSTEVTETVFDFRLRTPYTNSGQCHSAFLQHLGYSPRL